MKCWKNIHLKKHRLHSKRRIKSSFLKPRRHDVMYYALHYLLHNISGVSHWFSIRPWILSSGSCTRFRADVHIFHVKKVHKYMFWAMSRYVFITMNLFGRNNIQNIRKCRVEWSKWMSRWPGKRIPESFKFACKVILLSFRFGFCIQLNEKPLEYSEDRKHEIQFIFAFHWGTY